MKSSGDVLFKVLKELDFREGVSFPLVDRAVTRVLNQDAPEEISDPFWPIAGTLLIGHIFCFVLEAVGAFTFEIVFLSDILILSILCLVYRPLRRRADEREALRRELLFTLNRHSVAAENRRRVAAEEGGLTSAVLAAHSKHRAEIARNYQDDEEEVNILP